MKDSKSQKEVTYMEQQVLSKEDLEKLIQEKIKRAQAYYEACRKREALLVESC